MGPAARARLCGLRGDGGGTLRARAVHRRARRRQLARQTGAAVARASALTHVLFVATVHYRSERWVEIQTRHLRQHITVPFQIWTSLEGIDPSFGKHFDRVLEQR